MFTAIQQTGLLSVQKKPIIMYGQGTFYNAAGDAVINGLKSRNIEVILQRLYKKLHSPINLKNIGKGA